MEVFFTGNLTDPDVPSDILIFEPCETRKCVNISIADMASDPNTRLFYTLDRTTDTRIALNPSAGEVVIVDDDGTV